MIETAGTAAIVAAIEAMMVRPDSSQDLARISCPMLVVVGEEDLITPVADAVTLQNATARSRLVILPEAGHLSNLEVPDGFTLALADFLSSNL
jgi:pimeloyl-ACP methyl ester carboxylesterase